MELVKRPRIGRGLDGIHPNFTCVIEGTEGTSVLDVPLDIAAMCALLMSDDGSYITGQVINIDGGVTMRP